MLLSIQDLKVAFRMGKGVKAEAVKGVSFDIPENSTVALVGESGSGKSVTAMSVLNLLPDNAERSGRILWQGQDLLGFSLPQLQALRGKEIACVFQDPLSSLIPVFNVGQQLCEPLMKHRSREYVRAAEAIGASHSVRMFRHILPNISHVILVRMSLLVVGFIKAEVILSYLGLGVRVDQVSWGTMLAEAQNELILGHWWQLVAATLFMAVFVTAFSLMADALRDALDPKLRGLE